MNLKSMKPDHPFVEELSATKALQIANLRNKTLKDTVNGDALRRILTDIKISAEGGYMRMWVDTAGKKQREWLLNKLEHLGYSCAISVTDNKILIEWGKS